MSYCVVLWVVGCGGEGCGLLWDGGGCYESWFVEVVVVECGVEVEGLEEVEGLGGEGFVYFEEELSGGREGAVECEGGYLAVEDEGVGVGDEEGEVWFVVEDVGGYGGLLGEHDVGGVAHYGVEGGEVGGCGGEYVELLECDWGAGGVGACECECGGGYVDGEYGGGGEGVGECGWDASGACADVEDAEVGAVGGPLCEE